MTGIVRAPSLGDTPPDSPVSERPPSARDPAPEGAMPGAMPPRPPAVALDDVAVSLSSSSAAPAPDSPSEKSSSSMSRSGSASKRKGSVAQHGSNKEVHKAALEALEVMHKLPPGWHMTKDESWAQVLLQPHHG